MGQHRPEPAQRGGGDARAEGGDVTLQIGAQEILAPGQAVAVALRLKAVGETAAQPKGREPVRPHLIQQQGRHFDMAHPAGKGLCRLMQQNVQG